MTTVKALQAPSAGATFENTTLTQRDLRPDDVRIDIKFAGICHSDIHQVREEWGEAIFPMTPGHEIAGVVAEVGSNVSKYQVGDRVGVGCLVDSCRECEMCQADLEQFCLKGSVATYNARGYDGEETKGGYSQGVVVAERFVCRIPDGIELDVAAPLLCAGITTYSPLKRFGAGPGKKVAVIGVGGLGHMAVKIAAAMGAEVTTLSRSMDKEADAKQLGASAHHATKDKQTFTDLSGHFDIILNTVSADLPMNDYLGLLKPQGALVSVGIAPGAYEIAPFGVIGGSKIVAGSMIGGLAETQEMLDFCAKHGIGATIELIDADPAKVTEMYNTVVDGKVHYRAVIDCSTIGA